MFLASIAFLAALSGPPEPAKPKTEVLVVGGGCFWCLEAMFDELQGVLSAESGYAGGDRAGVTYEEVCSGRTGHAEVVRIEFDPGVVSREDLLRLFFTLHDPTQLNRQGPDYGPQYRSVVFYANDEEKRLAEMVRDEIARAKIWPRPIVTTLEPLRNYTRAEEYHQDYFVKFEKATPAQRMRMNAGYCSAIIEPKVLEFRRKFADRLKPKG
ncbi:MAG: peptide-methionine (S)-S-oxide reductase MsrA [Fimbriimonadales bacterium]